MIRVSVRVLVRVGVRVRFGVGVGVGVRVRVRVRRSRLQKWWFGSNFRAMKIRFAPPSCQAQLPSR